jgi:hypothetical protein
MQTFVPFDNFIESSKSLDNRRLNKQLLEGRQIYKIIYTDQRSGAWANHPAVKMWRGCDTALFNYLVAIKNECVYRGIKTDKNWSAITEMHDNNLNRSDGIHMPLWWGDKRVHQSHRNNLYRKDPEYYVEFMHDDFVSCCDKCNYFWPVASHTKDYTVDKVQ